MTTINGSLINEVQKRVQSYQEKNNHPSNKDERDEDVRLKKGCDELFEYIKVLIPDKVKMYAGYGRNEARVFDFKFRDELKFGDCFAKDLLTKGNVIKRLQEYMDIEHPGENGPAFFVYFTHIGKYQSNHSENKFGVFVNWDKASWETIKERIAPKPRNTEFKQNRNRHIDRVSHHTRDTRKERNEHAETRERKPFHTNSKPPIKNIDTTQPPKPESDDLPETHIEAN